MRALLLLVGLSLVVSAQAKKTVFMITDAEGIAGVCRQEQTEPTLGEMRQLLVGEVNAAVEGFFAGGADEVIVWDGHDGSRSISVLDIDPRAKLITGGLGPSMLLERKFAAIAFIGQHAMANVRGAIMGHSYNSLGIQNMRMNGKPVGELETRIALAGWYGVPAILVTGDNAAVEEYRKIVPNGEVAAVKEGLGRYVCLSLSAQAARAMTRTAAKRAMERLGEIRPYKVNGPVTIEIEHTTRNSLSLDAGLKPGTEVVDDRTIRYLGKDFMEAWTRYCLR